MSKVPSPPDGGSWSTTYLAAGAPALVETDDGYRVGTVYTYDAAGTRVTVMWPDRRTETFPRDQVQVRW